VIVGVAVAYLLVLVAIGVWARRGSGTVAGFYVADKDLPSWVVAFSSNATGESAWLLLGLTGAGYALGVHAFWVVLGVVAFSSNATGESAWLLLGLTGAGYALGVHAFWVVLGEVAGVAAAWFWVARPFKRETDRYDSITVPDYLEDRFRDTTRRLRWVAAIVIFTMVAVYLAAQLTAAGKAFGTFLGMGYGTGVVVGAVVVLAYTAVGGFKAVAYSDLLQGVLMVAALIVLPVAAVAAAGGPGATLATLSRIDPALLRPMGAAGLSVAGVASAVSLAGVGLAFLGVPQLLVRFISARSPDVIPAAGRIAVAVIIVFDVGAVVTGMAGRALVPALDDPETIMPLLSADLFPAVVTGLFLVVVLAAIMSTADSLLILASSAVVRDVLQKIYRPAMPERRVAWWGKVVTVVLGVAAVVVALGEVRVIFWFVLFAWSGLAAAFVPPVLCALFWPRTSRRGALAGMVTGFVVTVAWVLVFKAHAYDLYEMIPGVAAGLAATVGVSLLDRSSSGS